MFRQSLRRCVRISGATFATPALRTTRPAALQSIGQSSQSTLRVPLSINAFRLYSSESANAATAPAAEENGNASGMTTKFEDLSKLGVHSSLVDTITKTMRYEDMTDVQSKTIEPALKGMDLVAQAKTGTGKTLAFLVPIMQRMIAADPSLATRRARYQASSRDIRGIIVSPTRELAEQIALEAEKLCAKTGLVVQRAVGGTRKGEMLQKTRREGCHLLVGTPGRLNDLLSDPQSGIEAPNLAAIVLDEADRMLDVGFEKELQSIVDQLPDPRTSQRQTLLFSATIPKNVIALAREWVRPDNFDFIQTISKDDVLTHDRVDQHVVHCRGWANVFPAMYELIDTEIQKRLDNPELMPFKALVFLPTSALVDLVGDIDVTMRTDRDRVQGWRIHSKLTQGQRTRSAELFRNAKSGILFSTDVTARGLDFPNVTHVIQIGATSDREQYIHRLGRTARAGKEGEGWIILADSEMDAARRELQGLPLKPNKGIECAQFDFTSQEQPSEMCQKVTEATSRISSDVLNIAYLSLFGQNRDNVQAKADELREWFVDAMRLDTTPSMSASTADKRGLRRIRGLNIRENSRFSRDGDRDGGRGGYGGDRSGDRGNRGGFSRREPRDAFEKMEFDGSSSDRRQGGGFSRGGRDGGRGFGGRDRQRSSF
ncbi:DEAD/DEAH box helicase [Colletotrichum orchidophilum]|uniref:ATP-dependent RNA helicase n=1 Tax=Colletotrichum orchidophilum TaxID=1209926 RepID=A0A1G4ANR0_9PEZI|nr:DEAD/DEAH box helicase [Colletotrichum orchidophilum]OHE90725.1 DEAD/DEAH box helicase [Colletotrichum orchidophilum]